MVHADPMKLLYDMMRIRRMEELCAELYTQEKIRGFLHLYIGQEAVATGVISLLKKEDNVVGSYREHAHALLKGMSSKCIMAEMFGKKEGCARGRGGSMHLFSKDLRFFGGSAIVGSGIPHAVGLALASKRLGENRQTVCFFGEGAMAEGVFHESINMASLWKIPILFICENNLYAMGTALSRSQAQMDMGAKARCHNVEATTGDGMNIFDVISKTRAALEYIKKEGRPYFLELKTYRFRSHSMFDPELYRSKEEVEKWKERDPISCLKNYLFEKNHGTEQDIKDLQLKVEDEMQAAVAFAENGTWESIEDLEKDLYENEL